MSLGIPAKLGVAFAGTVAPVAAAPMSATVTAVPVITPRITEIIVRPHRSLLTCGPDASPVMVACPVPGAGVKHFSDLALTRANMTAPPYSGSGYELFGPNFRK